MNPKHHNPKQERRAHAPYNFVPLPEEVVTVDKDSILAQDKYAGKSGYIECSLTTMSPLYTRCAMTPDFFREHGDTPFHDLTPDQKVERAQFFHLKDERYPLIPGSSLRGMVRALVEIAGYGKVQWVTDKKLVYRGVGGGGSLGRYYSSKMLGSEQLPARRLCFDYPSQKVRGGYLEKRNGQCYIRPAKKDLNKESFVHVEKDAVNCDFHNPNQKYTNNDLIDVYLRPPAGRIERSNRVTLHLAVVKDMSDVDKIDPNTEKQAGFEKAVVVRSGYMYGKHMHCAIYEPDDKADLIQIPNPMWSLYEEDRDMTRGIETRPLKNDGDPLFYLMDDQDQLVFFGPTMMFRLPYDEPVNHFVPKDIREPDGIDLAEAIFGYVDREMFLFSWDSFRGSDGERLLRCIKDTFDVDWAQNAAISKSDDGKTILLSNDENSAEIVIDGKKEKATLKLSDGRTRDLKIKMENGKLNLYAKTARAGRVFFTDATLAEPTTEDIWASKEPITPKVLSSPKPTSFQHYLVQDRKKGHDPDNKNSLAHYATPSPGETVIRGCKMYWHKDNIPLKDVEADPANAHEYRTQHTRIKPVNAGVTFSFRIYFENLCKIELGALLWVMSLPGESGKTYYYKLGMGKPLGMGTVKIESKLYLSNRFNRYNQLFDGDRWAEAVNKDKDLQRFIDNFEKYVLDGIPKERRAAKRLNEVKRIKILLKMMEWSGPDTDLTEYLTIKTNEYKERRVLPDPLDISPS